MATDTDQTSVTPKGDITWYVKWFSSIVILISVCVRSAGIPGTAWIDLVGSFIGAAGWLIVGYLWRDRALILLNGVITAILLTGILKLVFVA